MTNPVISGAAPDLDVLPGTEVALTAAAEDKDTWNCDEVTGGPIRYEWSCDPPSTFKNGQWQDDHITWVAPSVPGTYKITAHALDDAPDKGDICGHYYDQMTTSFIYIGCHPVVIESLTEVPMVGGVPGAAIMTGGINNPVHRATLTAKIKPIDAGGSIRFEVQGSTGVYIPARLYWLDGTTGGGPSVLIPVDTAGEAKAILTSSDKDMETIMVQASYTSNPGTLPKTISVYQATGVHTVFECDPPSIPADGVSVTSIRFRLMQGGGTIPVPGHSITFSIESIDDIDDLFVQGPPWPSGYGTINPFPVVTDADGYAIGMYQVGTLGGTVNIKAEDLHDQALEEAK